MSQAGKLLQAYRRAEAWRRDCRLSRDAALADVDSARARLTETMNVLRGAAKVANDLRADLLKILALPTDDAAEDDDIE